MICESWSVLPSYRIRVSLVVGLSIIAILYFIRSQRIPFAINMISRHKFLFKITGPSQPIRCIVLMQHNAGRLGNRMFMVASAYGLARLHSCHLYLGPKLINELKTFFLLDFNHSLLSTSLFNTIANNSRNPMKRIDKTIICQYVHELARPNAIPHDHIFELRGFWQSYLHFAKDSTELRERIFAGTQPVLEKVAQVFVRLYQEQYGIKPQFSTANHKIFKQQLTESNVTTWIGIHVRRTDFVRLELSSSDQYIFTAIDYFTELYPNAHFIVASDDKPYCQGLFHRQSNIFVMPKSFSIGEDLIALSLCQHSIITAGTFGWWSAFLTNGRVFHDKIYPSGCESRELYYPPWFLIDGKVRAHMGDNYTL